MTNKETMEEKRIKYNSYMREWYRKNADRIYAERRERYASDAEYKNKVNESNKNSHEKNKGKWNKTRRDRYKKNPENRKKRREQNKQSYEKHKKKRINSNHERLVKLKIERMTNICNGELKCQWDNCNIIDHRLLSVRHVNGRLPEEYNNHSRGYGDGGRNIDAPAMKQIQNVSKEIFRSHLENDNYRIFCMNHGQLFEWGTFEERLKDCHRATRYSINRKIKRLQILGGKCASCNEANLNFLVADHIYNDGKDHKNLLNMSNALFDQLLQENRLQVLCHNCHLQKHLEGVP
jgi:hypothetical protein